MTETTAPTDRHVVTAVEFDVLWERLGLGPTPVVLRLESPGRTRTERRAIEARGWQALRERGLAGPTGAHPELVRLLRLLARPTVLLELRGWWGRTVRAMAAGAPDAGALAVRQDATVTVQPCGSLPSALLGVLPGSGPGPGRATTLPTDVLTRALGAAHGSPATGPAAGVARLAADGGLRAALVAGGVPATDAALLVRMLSATERRGPLVALTRGPGGGTPPGRGGVPRLGGCPRPHPLTPPTAPGGAGGATA